MDEIRPDALRVRGMGGVEGGVGGSSFSVETREVGNTRSRGTSSPSFRRTRSIFFLRSAVAEGIEKEGETGESPGDDELLGLIVNRESPSSILNLERE